jgi:hypothetical protein
MPETSINVPMSDSLAAWVRQTAAREERSIAAQVRHVLNQAMLRAGVGNGHTREEWPPKLPTVTPGNLAATKSQIAEWSEERDRLAKREALAGHGGLMPDQHDRLGQLRSWIATQQVRVAQLEGHPSSEPRRPAPPDLRGRP